jgi:VCBS repeat protein
MSFRFTTIDEPNAAQGSNGGTEVFGIGLNNSVIVGAYANGGFFTAFDDFLGSFATLAKPPGAFEYLATGVNDSGNVVGAYFDGTGVHGYLDVAGTISTLNDPKAALATLAAAIDDSGIVVGAYLDGSNLSHAFTWSGGVFSDLTIPGAVESAAVGINSSDDISGYYTDSSNHAHGFLDHNGIITTLDVPGSQLTKATGINDHDQVVGQYVDSGGQAHGFLYSGGHYTTFNEPNAATDMGPAGINNNGIITGSYLDASGESHGFAAQLATPHDFYDSGTAAMLWRNGSGLATWQMNGSSIATSGGVTYQGQALNPDASWSVAGIADFNADGVADVLWRQNGGSLSLWQMSGSTVSAANTLTYNGSVIAPDASWSIAGVGDFNADGEAAILWRGAGNSLSMWSMNGSTVTASNTVMYSGSALTPDASWSVAGVGDFNGDGYTDVVWRQSSGALALWDMQGSTVTSSSAVTYQGSSLAPDASWSVAGVGDFNGDGAADMLWRQSSGALQLWQMNNASVTSSNAITYQGNVLAPDASWHVVEIGDFDGNGKSDILWRNDNGTMAEWLMNGSQVTASVTPSSQGNPVSPGGGWSVQGQPTNFA